MKCLQYLKEKIGLLFCLSKGLLGGVAWSRWVVWTVERGGISFLPSSVLFLLGNPFRFCNTTCKCLKIGGSTKIPDFPSNILISGDC